MWENDKIRTHRDSTSLFEIREELNNRLAIGHRTEPEPALALNMREQEVLFAWGHLHFVFLIEVWRHARHWLGTVSTEYHLLILGVTALDKHYHRALALKRAPKWWELMCWWLHCSCLVHQVPLCWHWSVELLIWNTTNNFFEAFH